MMRDLKFESNMIFVLLVQRSFSSRSEFRAVERSQFAVAEIFHSSYSSSSTRQFEVGIGCAVILPLCRDRALLSVKECSGEWVLGVILFRYRRVIGIILSWLLGRRGMPI